MLAYRTYPEGSSVSTFSKRGGVPVSRQARMRCLPSITCPSTSLIGSRSPFAVMSSLRTAYSVSDISRTQSAAGCSCRDAMSLKTSFPTPGNWIGSAGTDAVTNGVLADLKSAGDRFVLSKTSFRIRDAVISRIVFAAGGIRRRWREGSAEDHGRFDTERLRRAGKARYLGRQALRDRGTHTVKEETVAAVWRVASIWDLPKTATDDRNGSRSCRSIQPLIG